MSETPVPYQTGPRADAIAARVVDEALALRHVLTLPLDERAEAAARLNLAAVALPGLLDAARRALVTAPALTLPDVVAMLNAAAAPPDERARLDAAAALLDPATGHAPETMAAAYAAALANTERAGDLRRVDEAAALLAQAKATPDARTRRACMTEAARRMERAERETVESLPDAWAAYRAARFTGKPASQYEVLRLDVEKRGPWAEWFNAWLGPRSGMDPGRCMMVGARPGAGKTSLAALLAVDAIAAECPVLFWQLELSREETLEHMLSQLPGTGRWWNDYWTKRCNTPLPDAWDGMLTIPRMDGPEAYEADTIREAMQAMARRAGKVRHACKGLVLVDYAQLLSVRDRRASTPQHEILTKAASMLKKTAADNSLCLVMLSQLTKESKKDQQAGKQAMEETAFTGGDLSRIPDVAFGLSHAKEGGPDGWEETGARNVTEGPGGEARLLANIKRRGWAKLDGRRPDMSLALWMSNERALHGGDAAPTPSRRSMPEDV